MSQLYKMNIVQNRLHETILIKSFKKNNFKTNYSKSSKIKTRSKCLAMRIAKKIISSHSKWCKEMSSI